jgi:4-diphosphocytidyl-2-C-methyl-D-erythritol kinase
MDDIILKSRAKINLTLDVTGKRPDGYHDIVSVMQTVSLYDSVYIKKLKKDVISVKSNLPYLPLDERNIVYKAARFLKERYCLKSGVFINLDKSIPVSGGLAGGSGNCAAVIIGMKKLFNLPFSQEEALDIGKTFGADVPFCLTQGVALVEGVGEKITRLFPRCDANARDAFVVLITPNVIISTAKVFSDFDRVKVETRPDTQAMIKAALDGNPRQIAKNFRNSLEYVTVNKHPIIGDIKEAMLKKKALGALMSGSGSTAFGYFLNKNDAYAALRFIRFNFKRIRGAFLCRTFPRYTPKTFYRRGSHV